MNAATALAMLDAETMRDAIASLPACADVAAGSGELAALWVKPGRYFNAHYRFLGGDGREIRASSFLVDAQRAARILESGRAHTCATRGDLACPACTTARVGEDLIVQAFPWDYRLPTLERCLDAKRVRRATEGLPKIDAAVARAYRPGMRCQIEYGAAEHRGMFGKVAVEQRGEGYSFLTHRTLAAALASSTRSIRVPAALAYVESLRLTLVEGVDGTSVHDLVDAGARPIAAVVAAAVALAAIHALESVVEDRHYGVDQEQELVGQWVGLCRELFPDLAAALDECLRVLAETRVAPAPPAATVHRDFYDKQVLCLDGAAPAVIDLDTAARGDREIDVANFCAHLRFRALQHGREPLYGELEDAFLGAYPETLDRRRLEWYRRATLVRLACNYALRPRWRHVAPRALALALRA
jgi:hypothetical protein